MLKCICIILMIVGCFGCLNKEVIKVPVSIPCSEPPEITIPKLSEVKFIAPDDKSAEACLDEQNARNLLEYMFQFKEYSKELETALDAYKNKK